MDWNNDGKKDLIAGDTQGNVTLFLNIGTEKEPKLAKGKLVEADGKPIKQGSHKGADTYSKIHMADWDGDGLKDLLVGHSETMMFYKNVGTQSAPRFQAPTSITPSEGKFPFRPSPYVVDWDGDGKKDLLVGAEEPKVFFYRNTGTGRNPVLAKGEALDLKLRLEGRVVTGAKMSASDAGYRWRIDVTDWNNDGKKDILVGNICSGREKAGGNIWLFLGK